MEISQKLREQILEKAKYGFLKTLEFILEEPEIKKVFSGFKRKDYHPVGLRADVITQSGFRVNYVGEPDITIRKFSEDVFFLRDLLIESFSDFELRSRFSEKSFNEDGSLKARHEKYNLDFGKHITETEYASIGLAFIEEIKSQKFSFELSDFEMQKMQLKNPVKKSIQFIQVFELSFMHHGKIEFTLPDHLPYPSV